MCTSFGAGRCPWLRPARNKRATSEEDVFKPHLVRTYLRPHCKAAQAKSKAYGRWTIERLFLLSTALPLADFHYCIPQLKQEAIQCRLEPDAAVAVTEKYRAYSTPILKIHLCFCLRTSQDPFAAVGSSSQHSCTAFGPAPKL